MAFELIALIGQRVCGGIVRKHLLTVLADRANPDGTGIWSSVSSLARDAECNDRTVQRHMRDFEREGILHQVGRRACRNGWTIEYRLDVGALKRLPMIDRSAGADGCTKVTGGRKSPVTEAEPVAESHPTGGGKSPLPVAQSHPNLPLEPIQEPIQAGLQRRRAGATPIDPGEWRERIERALATIGPAANQTTGGLASAAEFRRLCEPTTGPPCDFDRDVMPAVEELGAAMVAKRQQLRSWAHPGLAERAIRNRDRRLNGLPEINHVERDRHDEPTGFPAPRRGRPRSAATVILERSRRDELDEQRARDAYPGIV